MADGSVVIDTRLDNSQLAKGVGGLERVLHRITGGIRRAFDGQPVKALQRELQATQEAMAPIAAEMAQIEARADAAGKGAGKAFDAAQKKAGQLEEQYQALLAQMEQIEAATRSKYDLGITSPTMQANADAAFQRDLGGNSGYQKMIADAEALRQKQAELQAQMPQLAQAAAEATGPAGARYQELGAQLEELRTKAEQCGEQLADVGGPGAGGKIFGGVKTALSGVAKGAARATKSVARLAQKGFAVLAKKVRSTVTHLTSGNKAISRFGTRLRSIVGGALIFNLVSQALRNMVNYMGSALKSSGEMRTALANLKGAAATAAAPIIQMLTPALSSLVSVLATVCNYFARLISLVTGKSMSGMKAAAKTMSAYGAAAGKAGKQAQGALASFDDLNVLQKSDEESGGGAAGEDILPNYDFEGTSPFLDSLLAAIAAGDYYRVGALFATKINDALAGIDWEAIDTTVSGWADHLATGLNGFVETLDWGLLGRSLASGLNVGLHAVDTFFQKFHWDGLGFRIGTGLNNAVATLDWAALGRVLTDGIRAALESAHGFLLVFDWTQLGDALAEMVMSATTNIDWVQAFGDLGKFAIGLLTSIQRLIVGIDWQQIGQTVFNMLAAIDWGGLLANLMTLIGTLLVSATQLLWGFLSEAFSTIGTWVASHFTEIGENGILGFLNGMWSLLCDIGTWLYDHLVAPLVNGVKEALDIHSPSTVFFEIGMYLIMGLLNGITGSIGKVITFLSEKLEAIKQGFINTFNAIKETVGDIFARGLPDMIKSGVNQIIDWINGMISGVCSGINRMIDALNALSFDVPDWVPLLGGKSFGLNIGHVSAPQIPRLAQGAVLPANKPFLAMVGEQRHGTNVEAPLGTIKQALAEVLAQMGGGDREVVIKFAASGGLAELVRLLKPYIDKEGSRVGASMITGGVY